MSVEEAKAVIRPAPKRDTVYVDSTGHTWYIYVKRSGMIVMLAEEDTTERQSENDSSR